MMVLLAIPCCSGEPPPKRRRRTSAREQERNKPRPTGPHWTNQTHRYRAQNARPVLNNTAANCGPPFGTKRPQVQVLSPRPVPQVADLRECHALRAASHLPATATDAARGNKKG